MHSCDVLIVGGGPAGSACAWKLRRAGIDVAILDKSVFPRDKICGGWITPHVLCLLEIDVAHYASQRAFQPILGFRTSTIGARDVETHYETTVSYGIRRREFDHYLLKRSGARVFEGSALQTLEPRDHKWIVNGSIEARIVIGAGGHFCPVARAVGAKSREEHAVVAQEVEFEMTAAQIESCRVRAESPELYFCRDLRGYGWCFRKQTVLNIGLGRADSRRLPAHVSSFLHFLRSRIGFDPPAPRGHAYLLYGTSLRRIAGDGWVLIGDAAGLAYPYSGEGILPAIESGLLAAETIIAGAPEKYPERLTQHFAASESWVERAGAKIPSSIIKMLSPRLLASNWFARDVLLDRWFLHLRN